MATTHPQLNFASDKAIVGMIHVRALPGTPHHRLSIDRIVETAADEARVLAEAGCDALIIENMHDRPYLNRTVGPEIVAGMTAVAVAVRSAADLPLGVQVLGGANREALAVAQAGGAGFVRVEGFVFAHVADEGLMPVADAGPLLRYRKQIGAEDIAILADVKKKHASHSITADVDLAETARAAEFFGADGVIVTGIATGRPTDRDDVQCVKEAVDLPVAIGSGLTPENLACYWPFADLFIVGSFVKQDGVWSNPIDAGRLGAFMDAAAGMREAKRVK
ncbi:MAG: BtpA/SgcQ family protein [Planctomycetes bacterium]|nr:BtpA/SgcQ family protein [Planctomycetota bacterium]